MPKAKLISMLMEVHALKLVIVFCNTKRKVDEVVRSMKSLGYRAEAIHGDLNQAQRNKVLTGFRVGDVDMLVATDVAARGIDVNDIDAVFNYDLPLDPEYYVHRIGRTGRAGKTGKSFSFVTGRNESFMLRNIERFSKSKVERQAVPTEKELSELHIQRLMQKINHSVVNEDLTKFDEMVHTFCTDGLTTKKLAAALLKLTLSVEVKKVPERREENQEEFREDRNRGGRDDRRRDSREGRRDEPRHERSSERRFESRPERRFEPRREETRPERRFEPRKDETRPERRYEPRQDEARPARPEEKRSYGREEVHKRYERKDEKFGDRKESRHDTTPRFVKRRSKK